ncbi:receptor-transporting protein 3 [Pteropus medius]|uniref:receptor-transporting protein 3 n=1 Tax=Pteropus vampyrus TaxID=132908 RepID=UPI00196A6FFA|nr:receptor-transporting protein 3 [Pteropus giganteus]
MDQEMEVWQQEFQELIQAEKPWDQWTLKLDRRLTPNLLQPYWKQHQQSVFARFQCSRCSRSWASAQVQVLFHMHWNKRTSMGQVKMRVFAQRCRKCSQPSFEIPEFTEENISRILNNLVSKILKECYGERFKSMEEIPTIKDCPLKGAHDSDNCEACLRGFCARRGLDLATQSRTSPSFFSTSSSEEISSSTPSPTRSSTTEDSVTGNTQMKKEEALHRPRMKKEEALHRPRANSNHQGQSIIQVSTLGEDLYSHIAQNLTHRNVVVCCCAIIVLILIVVVVVIAVKLTN